MFRVKQQISFRSKVFWITLGLSLFVGLYSFVCWKQKSKNPLDTTVPNVAQFKEGFYHIFVPKKNELKSLFGTGGVEYDNPWIVDDSIATFKSLFIAIGIGSAIGVLFGIAMGSFAQIEYMFFVPLMVFAGIPPSAMLSVFIVMGNFLGWGENALIVALVVFGIAPTFARQLYLAVTHDIPNEQVSMAYTLGAANEEVVYNVIFPTVLPRIIDGIRMLIGPAFVYLILVELSLSDVGFGYRFRFASKDLMMNVVFIYLLILSLATIAMSYGLLSLRKWLCPWFEESVE